MKTCEVENPMYEVIIAALQACSSCPAGSDQEVFTVPIIPKELSSLNSPDNEIDRVWDVDSYGA